MRIVPILASILLIAGVLFFSCQKELTCEGCREGHLPPVALAGPDQVITFPTDTITLDGSSSSDPDGTIREWLWTKISGPTTFFMVGNVTESKIVVKVLATGSYKVELKITDNAGQIARDTVTISVIDPVQPNRPPVADAGPDQSIVLPQNTISVDASGSTDPDNNITSYLWTKISGPPAFEITTRNSEQSQITNLEEGNYQFELTVTDAGALLSKDTIRVNVGKPQPPPSCSDSTRPKVMARLVPAGILSRPRYGMTVVSAGNKILYAGGYDNGVAGSNVEIYDIVSQTSIAASLSVARYDIAAIAAGNKIFFGGGESGDGTWPENTVDIYDVVTGVWSATALGSAGNSIAAATVGNKVLFAGGDPGFRGSYGFGRRTRVDIYDLFTNSWSTASLSEEKIGATAVTVNDKVYFAGGGTLKNTGSPNVIWTASNVIDIYDNSTNSWSTSSMIEGKVHCAGIPAGDKIYWAGGYTGSSGSTYNSCMVEVMDVNTGSSQQESLFAPGSWSPNAGQNAVVKDNKIVFCRFYEPNAERFDIFDIISESWSIGILPQRIPEGSSIISVNNTIYIAGGLINGNLSDKVWKLEF